MVSSWSADGAASFSSGCVLAFSCKMTTRMLASKNVGNMELEGEMLMALSACRTSPGECWKDISFTTVLADIQLVLNVIVVPFAAVVDEE
jgi:hypothetical protein